MLKGKGTYKEASTLQVAFQPIPGLISALVACHGESRHWQLPFRYGHCAAAIHLVSSSMFDLVGPPSNARGPEPSLPSGALSTPKGTCIASTNPLVQVRPAGRKEGKRCLASMLPATHTVWEYNEGKTYPLSAVRKTNVLFCILEDLRALKT